MVTKKQIKDSKLAQDIQNNLGPTIAKIRKLIGMTQDALAEKSGISKKEIIEMEKGWFDNQEYDKKAERACKGLGITTGHLVTLSVSKKYLKKSKNSGTGGILFASYLEGMQERMWRLIDKMKPVRPSKSRKKRAI